MNDKCYYDETCTSRLVSQCWKQVFWTPHTMFFLVSYGVVNIVHNVSCVWYNKISCLSKIDKSTAHCNINSAVHMHTHMIKPVN